MGVNVRSVATASGATAVSLPTGAADHDDLTLVVVIYDDTTPTITASGFTSRRSQLINAGASGATYCEVFTKTAASEAGSFTVTNNHSSFQELILIASTGADETTPVDTTSANTHVGSTGSYTATWTGVTVARDGSLMLCIGANYNQTTGIPSGMTAVVTDQDSVNDVFSLAVNAGATGDKTATMAADGASLNFGVQIVVILQPPAGVSVSGGLGGSGGTLAAQADVKIATDVALGGSGGTLAANTSSGLTVDAALTGSGGALAAAVDLVDKADVALGGPGGAIAAAVGVVDKADVALGGSGGSLAASVSSYYFEDEFSGASIDSSLWNVMNRISDQVNSELDCCVPAMVTVSGGSAQLTAEVHTQSCGDEVQAPTSQAYRSGHIQQATPSFIYPSGGEAIVDVRAKAPGGTGLWPTIFLLGWRYQSRQPATANPPEQDWPNGGWCEVDIAEFLSGHRTQVNNKIHNNGNHPGTENSISFDASTQHAVWRLRWSSGSMIWQVDAEDGSGFVTLQTITGSDVPAVPMYLCINVAVGGIGGGSVTDATLPQHWDIDYVRITAQGEVIADVTVPGSGAALAANVTNSLLVSAGLGGSGAALAAAVDVKVAADAALAGSGAALAAAVDVVDTVDAALAGSGAALAAGITADNPVTVNLGGSGAVMAASVDVVDAVDAALAGGGGALAAAVDATNVATAALPGSGGALAAQVGAVDAVTGALNGSGGRVQAVFDGASTVDQDDDFFLS